MTEEGREEGVVEEWGGLLGEGGKKGEPEVMSIILSSMSCSVSF